LCWKTLAAKNQALLAAQQELEEANAILKALSLTDGLTGAYNRLYFDRQLLVEWQRARREQQCLTLILVDIDHFKAINDTYGHPAGDAGLKLVTAQLQDNFRRGNDFVCRYGGEEFAVLLPHTTPEQAAIHAERCRLAVASTPLLFNGDSIPMTISIGIGGLVPSRDHEPLDLLHATDQMLYRVKRHGRNNLKIADTILADKITHPRADSEAH
jgi:diguanylate cyclase (GGDEF)-like protein